MGDTNCASRARQTRASVEVPSCTWLKPKKPGRRRKDWQMEHL